MNPSKSKRVLDFPPDIFWISPEGEVLNVIGHVSSIQVKPKAYGLRVGPKDLNEIESVFNHLSKQGWVRGRYNSGTFSFQIDRPREIQLANAVDLVYRFQAQAKDVRVDFLDPTFKRKGKSISAKDFLTGCPLCPGWRRRLFGKR